MKIEVYETVVHISYTLSGGDSRMRVLFEIGYSVAWEMSGVGEERWVNYLMDNSDFVIID